MLEVVRPDYFEIDVMINRIRQENQGFFEMEHHWVIDELQKHDSNLNVIFNARKRKWRVIDNTWHCIMEVPYSELDSRTVEHIKRIDSHRGYRAIERIKEIEEQIERDMERREQDMVQDMARELKPALDNAAMGRTDGVQRYYNGVSLS